MGSPCSLGNQIVLLRSEPLTQNVSATSQGPGPTPPVMNMSDKLTMISQQLQGEINQALLLPVSTISPVQFPSPPGTSGQLIGWDPTGTFLVNEAGVPGPQGPQGLPGTGTGNVNGPASNSANFVPQWNGANSLTLSNGLGVGTSANNLVQLTSASKLPAVDGSLLSNVNAITINGNPLGTSANNVVQLNGSAALPAVSGANLTSIPLVSQVAQPFVKITNTQTSGTSGGTASTGSWVTMPLTTKNTDSASIATLTTNVITLPAGTYLAKATSPFYETGLSQIRLYNQTASAVLVWGSSIYCGSGGYATPSAVLDDEFTLSAQSNVVLQYEVQYGGTLGIPSSYGNEVYAQIEFTKVN